jgi:rhodanese-related sulfurtransferase
MKYFPLQVAIILGAGLATGFAFSLTSNIQLHTKLVDNSDKPPPVRPGPTGSTGVTAPTGVTGATGPTGVAPIPEVKPPVTHDADLISVEAAKAIFDTHNAVFIDARPKPEFLVSHITGAMHLEKGDLDGAPPAKVLNYLPGVEVVVYCHGELCTDSANVIKRLLALNKGIGPMHIIKAGFPGWVAAKHPVESGPEAGFQ